MDVEDHSFKRIDKIGSAAFFVSENGEYFKKKIHDNPEILFEEYKNLKKLHGKDIVKNLKFIEPIEVTEKYLVTRYVDASSLLEDLRPRIYNEFGERLKKFHQKGYTHSHLQFNDVLYDGMDFYLTDLRSLNKREPIKDLVVPKVGLTSFKIKKPWRWRSYDKCFEEFLNGYGDKDINCEDFIQSYNESFNKRVNNVKYSNPAVAGKFKAYSLNLMKKLEM